VWTKTCGSKAIHDARLLTKPRLALEIDSGGPHGLDVSDQPKSDLKIFCRQCGGERFHPIIDQETRTWEEDDTQSL
jgi:hypothetical protein